MKTISVPAGAKAVNDLLKRARRSSLILQSVDGRHFLLASIENWEGFDVGSGDNFAREVKLTGRNKKLMKFLAQRRGPGKTIPLVKVKKQLGLD